MLSTLKQVLGLLILGFAVLGFVAVPLDGQTGLQHVQRFWEKPETQEAAATLQAGVEKAATGLEEEMKRPTELSTAAELRKNDPLAPQE